MWYKFASSPVSSVLLIKNNYLYRFHIYIIIFVFRQCNKLKTDHTKRNKTSKPL